MGVLVWVKKKTSCAQDLSQGEGFGSFLQEIHKLSTKTFEI